MFLNSSTRLLRGCLLLNSRFTVQRNFASFLSANTSTFRPSAVVVQRRNFCIADDFESDGEKAVAKKKPQTSTEGVIMLVNEEGSVVLNDTTNEKVRIYARKVGLQLEKVMSGKGKNTVFKLVKRRDRFQKSKKQLEQERKKIAPGKKVKEIRFSTVISENDVAFKLRKVIGYLEKGHNVKVMALCKKSWEFNQEEAKEKLQEIISQIDPDIYKIQQSEIIVPSQAAVGCMIQPRPSVIKKKKEQELKEQQEQEQQEQTKE